MIRKLGAAALLFASAIALSACIVEGPGYAGHPRCPGGWVPAHQGPEGGWHPGHCV